MGCRNAAGKQAGAQPIEEVEQRLAAATAGAPGGLVAVLAHRLQCQERIERQRLAGFANRRRCRIGARLGEVTGEARSADARWPALVLRRLDAAVRNNEGRFHGSLPVRTRSRASLAGTG